MILVVDASVGVKWFVEEDYSDAADWLLEDFAKGKVDLKAPKTFIAEFCNAIRKYVVRRKINEELARQYIWKMAEIPIDFIDIDWEMTKIAYRLALDYSITVYDAIYLTLAQQLDAIFITADDKLFAQLKGKVRIIHIKDYSQK